MCEYVFLPPNVIEEMKHLISSEYTEDYFPKFESMTNEFILKNRNGHKVIKAKILGVKGIHDIVIGTLNDAMQVKPDFLKVYL